METLAGRYQLEERLGSGGSAVVWRATDTALNVRRAVKLLHVERGPERETLRERLRAEARAMARLAHPNVVAVHDVGEDGERDFIVMDLVDGASLADQLEQNGPLDTDHAVRIAVQVLDALAVAHEQGIVHRDVKPGNVLLDGEGNGHLCDFGIALAEAADNRHTRTGTALGSLPYMSPEQRRDARSVGPAADLYAVGSMLYNALTCATPVDLYLAPGRSPRWAMIPSALVPVLRRATAADPGDRYPSAKSMSRALVVANAPKEPLPKPKVSQPTVEEATEHSPNYGVLWVNVGVMVLVLVTSWVIVDWLNKQRPEPVPVPVEQPPPAPVQMIVQGTWLGPLEGTYPGIRVELDGPDDALNARVMLQLSEDLRRESTAFGHWAPLVGALVLDETQKQPGYGRYEAHLDDDGVLRGTFRSEDSEFTVSFALVRAQ